jgi:CDP-paratose 2-epimerase
MPTAALRGGCLTGPNHSGVELHGFLSYLVKAAVNNIEYTIYGYKGKQVRDQIHSYDVVLAMEEIIKNPKPGEVFNLGGGKENSASILECIDLIKKLGGYSLQYKISDTNRIGDHICYYSDTRKLQKYYPNWEITISIKEMIQQIIKAEEEKLQVS